MSFAVLQEPGVTLPDEDHAAGRGGHHVIIPGEEGVHPLGQRPGILLEPGVGHRLAAAGLVERILHVASQPNEQFVGSARHPGVERIDVTGNKESDFHRKVHVCPKTDLKYTPICGKWYPQGHKKRGAGNRLPRHRSLGRDYLISMRREAATVSSTLRLGISMVITPCSTLAEIFSVSTLSGSSRLCWKRLYENSRRR